MHTYILFQINDIKIKQKGRNITNTNITQSRHQHKKKQNKLIKVNVLRNECYFLNKGSKITCSPNLPMSNI